MMSNRLSDEALLSRLHTYCGVARRVDVRLIVLLIEVEERRLHLTTACSSLFDFCRRRLGMRLPVSTSPHAAGRNLFPAPCRAAS